MIKIRGKEGYEEEGEDKEGNKMKGDNEIIFDFL